LPAGERAFFQEDRTKGDGLMQWLFAAFAVVWIVFFLYLLDLGRKQRAIAREIESLKARLGHGPN
jgi:CcmD family protein